MFPADLAPPPSPSLSRARERSLFPVYVNVIYPGLNVLSTDTVKFITKTVNKMINSFLEVLASVLAI
jgi:hypothetical protein